MIEIQRLVPLSVCKVMAIVYFGLTCVFAVPLVLLALAVGDLAAAALAVALPPLYGVGGAVTGLLGGMAYNVAARAVGGLQLRVSE